MEKSQGELVEELFLELKEGYKRITAGHNNILFEINESRKDMKRVLRMQPKIDNLVGKSKAPSVERVQHANQSQFNAMRKIILEGITEGHSELRPLMPADKVVSDRYLKLRCTNLKPFKFTHVGATMSIDLIIGSCIELGLLELIEDSSWVFNRYAVKGKCYRVLNGMVTDKMPPMNTEGWS